MDKIVVLAFIAVGSLWGCAATPKTEPISASDLQAGTEAIIHVHGLNCPFCIPNLRRSVERVGGVKEVSFDLNTGRGRVVFEPDRTVAPATLWQAISKSSFTPVRIEIDGKVYEGPEQ